MDLAPQSGIIVDSSFSSRKELVRDLTTSKLVEEIYEATSIADAIKRLIAKQTDICFIGPTVSTPVVVNFAKSVNSIPSLPSKLPCALVAVVRPGQTGEQESELLEAGVSGVLQQPYDKETFTSITLKAIRQARLERGPQTKVSTSSADLLASLAVDLFKHSDAARFNLSAGSNMRFQQKLYGEIRNSISRILAKAAGADHQTDPLFARTVTEWFFEAAHSGRAEATERLRMKLISNTLD